MEDIFNIISSFLPASYIIIVLGLIVIGEMLKKFTTLPNQLLTTALPIIGAITTGIMYSSSIESFEVATLIQQIFVGLVLGWAATGGFEWFQNTFVRKTSLVKTISVVEKEIEKPKEELIEQEECVEQNEQNEQ